MEFRQLRYFLKIYECRSFTGAAKALNLSQSALSLSIKDLEANLGVQVFIRGAKHIELTKAGHKLAGYATAILQQQQKALADLAQIQSEQGHTIEIGINSAFPRNIWDEVLALFYKRAPNTTVNVSFSAHPLDEVIKNLERNIWDVAISLDPDSVLSGQSPKISCEHITSSTSQIYARAEHEIHSIRTLSLGDLRRFEWAVSTTVTSLRMFQALQEKGEEMKVPRVALYADSFDLIMGAVAQKDLLCFAPTKLVEQSGLLLQAVHQDLIPAVVSEWKLMCCNDLQKSAPTRIFMGCVRKVVASL